MNDLTVERTSKTAVLAWAYFFGLILLGVLLYFGLEALAPPPDRIDKDLVHARDFAVWTPPAPAQP